MQIASQPYQSSSRKNEATCHRAGYDPGSIIINGQRVASKKPGVKRGGCEVQLKTYQALQSYDLLCQKIMNHMLNGVSTRGYEPLIDEIFGE